MGGEDDAVADALERGGDALAGDEQIGNGLLRPGRIDSAQLQVFSVFEINSYFYLYKLLFLL